MTGSQSGRVQNQTHSGTTNRLKSGTRGKAIASQATEPIILDPEAPPSAILPLAKFREKTVGSVIHAGR